MSDLALFEDEWKTKCKKQEIIINRYRKMLISMIEDDSSLLLPLPPIPLPPTPSPPAELPLTVMTSLPLEKKVSKKKDLTPVMVPTPVSPVASSPAPPNVASSPTSEGSVVITKPSRKRKVVTEDRELKIMPNEHNLTYKLIWDTIIRCFEEDPNKDILTEEQIIQMAGKKPSKKENFLTHELIDKYFQAEQEESNKYIPIRKFHTQAGVQWKAIMPDWLRKEMI